MGELRYHEDLQPILALAAGEAQRFIRQTVDECGSVGTHFYNHNRYRELVLEYGGLHAARALRVWNALYVAEIRPPTPPSLFAYQPESVFGTDSYVSKEEADSFYSDGESRCSHCGRLSDECECDEEEEGNQ